MPLRSALRPFVIRPADGREYPIEHPDFVLAAASDVPRITSIEHLPAPSPSTHAA